MATYQKVDMIVVAQDSDPHVANAKASNKSATESSEIRQRTFTFRDLYKDRQLSADAAKFGDSITVKGVSKEERAFVIKQKPDLCIELFKSLLSNFRSLERIKYILTLLADITEVTDTTVLLVTHHGGDELASLLLNMLGRHDRYCQHQACLCIARIISHTPKPLASHELNQFMGWIIAHLKHNNEYLDCITKALMSFLRRLEYRQPFYEADGVKPILSLLDHRLNFQLQYELVFSLWTLSFDVDIVNRMKEHPIAAVLSDVLKTTNRPKVQRIILATFRNLLEKAVADTADKFAAEMIHFKALQVLNVLESQSLDDTDFEEDIEFLQEKLKLSLQDLSTFDEYVAEVKSQRLEWSPVHKSDKFWRENVMKLNDNDYYLLRLLIAILSESQNPTAMAVASHDLGEYVRYYPRGKNVIDRLGAKEIVMNLVNHGNTEVRMQALLSIQKMMVQNWEYLGKQLETKS